MIQTYAALSIEIHGKFPTIYDEGSLSDKPHLLLYIALNKKILKLPGILIVVTQKELYEGICLLKGTTQNMRIIVVQIV